MEDVLDCYEQPYNPKEPVVCFDEMSKQLIGETRLPLPMQPGQVQRYDYEYERRSVHATCFCSLNHLPTGGMSPSRNDAPNRILPNRCVYWWMSFIRRRPVSIWFWIISTRILPLPSMKPLMPDEARRILRRIHFHYTPKHASWLNMAEIEFSVFSRACLQQRIPDEQSLKRHVAALELERNNKQATVDWQFTCDDARIKLKRFYPSFS